jgi:hypothetical protein
LEVVGQGENLVVENNIRLIHFRRSKDHAPEVIHFTTRILEGKGPDYGTLQDALELLKIYEAYLQPDQIIQPIAH